MSISGALNNALSGLSATSRMAEVVSNNLSNSMTEGYARRSVQLSASVLGAGGGVRIAGIDRFVDAGLLADRRLSDAALSAGERGVAALTSLEIDLGGPDDASSLSARLASLESAFISASSDPSSDLRLGGVLSRLSDVADTLQANSRAVQDKRQEADANIASDIGALNRALVQAEELNSDILKIQSRGGDPGALLDARQTVIDQIAEIVPVREMQQGNGSVWLLTPSGTTLLNSRAVQFDFSPSPVITPEMTFASGALSGISVEGVPIDVTNGIGRLDGGSLGAAFDLRDNLLVDTQNDLDVIAADLVARFADPANDATLTAGDPGLLTDGGAPFAIADLEGLSSRITVNAAIDPAQAGELRLLRDGLNSAVAGPVGNTTQIDQWIGSISEVRSDVPGVLARSAAGRIAELGAELGTRRLAAEERLSYTGARWDALNSAELANGVDTDQELQILLRIEQAYAANAKVMQSADFMMQRLMEL